MASNQMFFLEHFVKNYSGKEFTTEDLMKDEVISRLISSDPVPEELLDHAIELQEKTVKKSPEKSPKKSSEKSPKKSPEKSPKKSPNPTNKKSPKQDKPKKDTSLKKKSLEERSNEEINHNKCLCRLWKNGLDNIQCSGNKLDGGDFCKRHSEFGSDWWCGLITEPRPEEAVGPSTKPKEKQSRHYWHDQEKPAKKKKSVKKEDKPVKKDKKSDEEDKDVNIAGGVGKIPDTKVNKDIDELPDIIESSDDEDTEETTDFEIDGVIYKRLLKDDLIMDCKSGTQMAYLKEGKFSEFFNDDAIKLHEFNKM